jgi:hypothetical protein
MFPHQPDTYENRSPDDLPLPDSTRDRHPEHLNDRPRWATIGLWHGSCAQQLRGFMLPMLAPVIERWAQLAAILLLPMPFPISCSS